MNENGGKAFFRILHWLHAFASSYQRRYLNAMHLNSFDYFNGFRFTKSTNEEDAF